MAWSRVLTILGVASLALLALSGGFLGAVGMSRYMERHDPFCISCHLHQEIYEKFLGPQGRVVTLATLHHTEKGIKCIDCHGLDGLLGRTQTMLLGARDTLKFLSGYYQEPEKLTFPIPDLTCLKCHEEVKSVKEEQGSKQRFHGQLQHVKIPTRCLECHLTHIEGIRETLFLKKEIIDPICEECHKEL